MRGWRSAAPRLPPGAENSEFEAASKRSEEAPTSGATLRAHMGARMGPQHQLDVHNVTPPPGACCGVGMWCRQEAAVGTFLKHKLCIVAAALGGWIAFADVA